ncbi:MAG TPA: SGNH/GDSL hydrolase family protein [Pyrinomonadaceae bacterium]|nr:SGNH/GDSL hydrolase family protein [Pyrinomonadaceae bacterium]
MKIIFLFLIAFLFLSVIAGAQEKSTPPAALQWRNIRDFGVEGKGWSETKHFYDRLPAKAETVVRAPVWRLSQNSAGISVRFVTDADSIWARWTLRSPTLAMSHMPATGVSGLDLYVKDAGKWHWLGVGKPEKSSINEQKLIANLKPEKREYLLYLPLYNGVESVEVGVPEKAFIEKAPAASPENTRPIVFYGTSIVQGAVASRPGMTYPSILSRRLNKPAINLGFSGNGRAETEMANLVAEIDAAVYVVDCLPNLSNRQEVEERVPGFLRILREKHPSTPIVLVENIVYADTPFEEIRNQRYREKNEALRRIYQNLIKSGFKRLYYVAGDKMLGFDSDATVDGTHPTDLGFFRIADVLEPFIKNALKSRKETNK